MSFLCNGGLVLDLDGQFFRLCWGAGLSFRKFRVFVLLLLVFSSVGCLSFLFWPGGWILGSVLVRVLQVFDNIFTVFTGLYFHFYPVAGFRVSYTC